jgi:hypothetical protein
MIIEKQNIMKKIISAFFILLACSALPAQDTTKAYDALVIERVIHGKPATGREPAVIKTGEEVKVYISGVRNPFTGILGEITDSTIRVDSNVVLVDDIVKIGYYPPAKKRQMMVLAVTGGVMACGGGLLVGVAMSDRSDLGEAFLAVVSGIPLFVAGVIVEVAALTTLASGSVKYYSINERRRVRAGRSGNTLQP